MGKFEPFGPAAHGCLKTLLIATSAECAQTGS